MPINTDLNIAPYFDDFNDEKQFYKILFKPAYAVQARELTQLQSILQNQVEQFGDNIYQEGSIIKGCNFTQLDSLEFVKVVNKTDANGIAFDVEAFISGPSTDIIDGIETNIDVVYELEGTLSGLRASVIFATRGFETRPPNLNTFYINYLTTNESGSSTKTFIGGETLNITRKKFNGSNLYSTETNIDSISVTRVTPVTGKSYGLQASAGVIFQKGHFLFTSPQTIIVSKYDNFPNNVSVGYEVVESLVTSSDDPSLFDNANGSTNENAPGADRLKLTPVLVSKNTADGNIDQNFFTLIRYRNGTPVTIRDVSQFNSIGEELAKRTYEESGDYIQKDFVVKSDRRGDDLKALVGSGVAYVKGYRIENHGELDFTVDQISNTAVVPNQSFSVDYGSYVDVVSINGNIDTSYGTAVLQENIGGVKTNIGEAIVRSITPNKIYLFGSRMTTAGKTFRDVDFIKSAGGDIEIAQNSVVKETNKGPLIFPTGMFSLKDTTNISLPIRSSDATVQVNSNTIVLDYSGVPNQDFAIGNDDMVFVDSTNTYIPILSYSVNGTSDILTINLDPTANSSSSGTLYFNKRIITATPYAKTVRYPYIRINYSPSQTKYSLGFPDVFNIESITDGAGTDFTDSFRLKTNQKDNYYDISYIEYIPRRPIPTTGTLTIKLNVFEINSSSGSHFFTIRSYPVDDETPSTDPAFVGKVRSWQLNTYQASNRKVYNLRECFDFRPYADKDPSASYTATTPGSAPLITAQADLAIPEFSRSDYIVPALKQFGTADLEHYLSRIDVIAADSYANIKLIKGDESAQPVPPKVGADLLVLSNIIIPGYPALSLKEAADQGKPAYGIRAKASGVKNYTMKDISKLEKKIDKLEYYISLNQLEQSVENLLIQDENGLTRFKNGFIVDPFNDFSLANLQDTDFSAAIHFDRKILTPSLRTFPLDMKYKSSTNASIFPTESIAEVGTLSRDNNIPIISQEFATTFRSCVSNYWKYDGIGQLVPNHDMAHDTTTNPLNLEIDLATPFTDFVDNLQQIIPLTGVSTEIIGEWAAQTRRWSAGLIEQVTTNTLVVNETTESQFVGDFVSNIQFSPYMRSKEIKVYVAGLRPNTRHYFFFDGVDVNAHVQPGVEGDNGRDVMPSGEMLDPVTTDDNGVLRAIFMIPAETFFVGERMLTIADVDNFAAIDASATSTANLAYNAYNISVDRSSLTMTTRIADTDINTEITPRNLPRRRRRRRFDPLAQTFFVKKGMGEGSDTVFISKVDLYFKRKSVTNGVTIMLREVDGGYPAPEILPFSKVHLTPNLVNVSDDASAVTTVNFDAPIRLDVEKEYALVIMPDANDPDYLVFTSKVGGTDLTPGESQGFAVVQDWGDGVLFTSTNNTAWISYQDEDLKFILYRHDFNSSLGSITLTNNDHEFLTLSDWNGRFSYGEKIYVETAVGNTVSAVLGSKIINGTGVDFTALYSVGDYIRIQNASASRSDIFRIVGITDATTLTIDRPISFVVSNGIGTPVVVGEVSYYNKLEPETIHLQNSTARSGRVFSAGSTIRGFTSGTEGTISSVDNIKLSYVQPLIPRVNDIVTTTRLTGVFTDPNNVGTYYTAALNFADNNYFTDKGVSIYSKSNDPSRQNNFDFVVSMSNQSNRTSTPLIDLELSSLLGYQFITTDNPDTTSKYISKTIELAEDLDAEDMELILTSHRPIGTDIKVYVKVQNVYDSSNFETNPWVELELFKGNGVFASSANLNDYREYSYRVPASSKDANGVIQYDNASGETFFGYRRFAIRIDLIADDINVVPMVKDYRGIALT